MHCDPPVRTDASITRCFEPFHFTVSVLDILDLGSVSYVGPGSGSGGLVCVC